MHVHTKFSRNSYKRESSEYIYIKSSKLLYKNKIFVYKCKKGAPNDIRIRE